MTREQILLDQIEFFKQLLEEERQEEKEKGPVIPSWEKALGGGYVIRDNRAIPQTPLTGDLWRELYATKAQAERALAFAQLSQIHRKIIELNCPGWVADWEGHSDKFAVVNDCRLEVEAYCSMRLPLTLPTEELAQAFLEAHRDLWATYYAGL